MTATEVAEALADLPGWAGDENGISRTYQAPGFADGIALVVDAARTAEEIDHHPDIDIRWRAVTFRLTTHSAGGVTGRDVDLARAIDRHAERRGAT